MTGPRPSAGTVFIAFLQMGLCGFGGVLPWVRRGLVEKHRWMTEQEFIEILSLSQFLPGPNIVNLAIYSGVRLAGWRGAVAAIVGLLAAPCAIAVALAALYTRYAGAGPVAGAIGGVSSAAAGLVIAMGLKMARPVVGRPESVVIAALAFVAVALLQLPLAPVLVVLLPLGIAAAALAPRLYP